MSDLRRSFGALLPHVGIYGGVRRFVEIGNELVRCGHEFTLFTPSGEKPDWLEFKGRCGRLAELRDDEPASGSSPSGGAPDILMCGDTGLLDAMRRARARLKLMFVIGRRYALKYARFLDCGFVLVGVSSDWKSYMSGADGYTIPGGVNLDLFRRSETVSEKSGESRLLTFGTPRKRVKGSVHVLRAYRELARRAGAGQGIRSRLARLLSKKRAEFAVSLTLFDREPIELPGWARRLAVKTVVAPSQKELVELYSRADIFISCEESAGWCNSVAEAMACGTPVVCGPVGTVDVAEHEKTALVVRPGDHKGIADAVERLLGDVSLRESIARAAYEHVSAFSWQAFCRRLLAVVDEKLGA
ncbi:MAG: glycosyltransferase family 4 protein [Planctomycetota bacterium]|nr:glycosyltransferase family 4 protein [Planctomycetota bacterium]